MRFVLLVLALGLFLFLALPGLHARDAIGMSLAFLTTLAFANM